ncbi:MAG: efflux RND transporter periplasmic adaptor subunit [Oligoflexia bacterium]|nr:efflux RND transporter periplasmic adaptor subunit [Oligoflexia bacterium]
MTKSKINSKWIIGIVILAAFAAGLAYKFKKSNSQLAPVVSGKIQEAIYGLGKVKSHNVFEAKPGVTGTIRKMNVREGQSVAAGERLVELDEGVAIRSPFSGTVTHLPFHEGENIFPQAVLLRVEDLKSLYVEVSLEQQGALRVRPAQLARLSFESLRGTLVKGAIQSVYPKDDQFIVRIKVDNIPPEILPGMTADVAIEVGSKDSATLVPASSISNGTVTIFRNGNRQKTTVKIGIVDGNQAEILEGDVRPGDEIVTRKE